MVSFSPWTHAKLKAKVMGANHPRGTGGKATVALRAPAGKRRLQLGKEWTAILTRHGHRTQCSPAPSAGMQKEELTCHRALLGGLEFTCLGTQLWAFPNTNMLGVL